MGENAHAPVWLNTDFLLTCLRSDERYKEVIITHFVTSPAVPPGNNFGSNIYRVSIEYKDGTTDCDVQQLSIIVKAPLTDGPFQSSMLDNSESRFYDEFLPKAIKLLNDSFAPTRFDCPDKTIIVMEDLKAQGFLLADKVKKLDFEHCTLYIRAAAKFHAVSHVVCKQSLGIIESVCKNILFSNDTKLGELNGKFSFYGVECMAEHIAKMEKYKEYALLLKDYSSRIWNDIVEAYKPMNEDFNCLNQGDTWITNMMFKYDQNGRPVDIKLLDFQAIGFTSPLTDVVFFFYTCANIEVQKTRIDDLLQMYMTELNANLEKLKCNYQLSYQHLKEKVHRLTPVIIWLYSCYYPVVVQDLAPDFNGLFAKIEENPPLSENPLLEFYNENYYTSILPELVRLMEQKEVFSYLSAIKCKSSK